MQENLNMLLCLDKKFEGLIEYLSSESQFIKDGPVAVADPRSLRLRLNPFKYQNTDRRLFLVSSAALHLTFVRKGIVIIIIIIIIHMLY